MKHTIEEIKKMVAEECLCCEKHPGIDVDEIISDLVEAVEGINRELQIEVERSSKLVEKNQRLREALEFYAKNTYWVKADDNTDIGVDVGEVARKALEGK